MGEYAKFAGREIKIGTCEDMYYLRADQAATVQQLPGSLDPADKETRAVIRFRFPWPDEDGTEPGAFKDYERSLALWDVTVPEAVEHHSVQFVGEGYNVCLPCPEGPDKSHGLTVHRNGFPGPVRIVQQAYRNGNLALICACGGCGARYNLPTLKAVEQIIVAVRSLADRAARQDEQSRADWLHAVAERIAAGYEPPPPCLVCGAPENSHDQGCAVAVCS